MTTVATHHYLDFSIICDQKVDVGEWIDILEIQPSLSYVQGDTIHSHVKKLEGFTLSVKRKESAWCYKTNLASSLNLFEHQDKIIELFSPKINEINLIRKRYGASVIIDFVINIYKDAIPNVCLTREFMSLMDEIRVERIDFPMYRL